MELIAWNTTYEAVQIAARILSWSSAIALFSTILLLQSKTLRDYLRLSDTALKKQLPLITAIFLLTVLQQTVATREDSSMTRTKVENFIAVSTPEPYSLEASVKDLREHMAVQSAEAIEIKHLALDMSDAWNKVKAYLLKEPRTRPIKYELLMLTEPPKTTKEALAANGLPLYPKDAQRWAESGKNNVIGIYNELHSYQSKEGPKFDFKIKQYSEIPFVHGFQFNTKSTGSIYYMALCRWEKNHNDKDEYDEFGWGEFDYFRLLVSDPKHGKVNQALAKIFEGFFAHLWQTGTEYSPKP